jgi:hypothetical protein
MKAQLAHKGNSRRGAAMLYALFAAFTAATMVSVMMSLSLSTHRSSNTQRRSLQARYLAEGAIEVAKRDVANAVANWAAVPAAGKATIDGVEIDYTVTPTGFSGVSTDPSGIQTLIDGYEIRADATSDGHQSVAHRLINTEATPIFQFAVFYTEDLEINPGQDMTIRGRIHTNKDMYLNTSGVMTLDTNYVRAVGNLYRDRKGTIAPWPGSVTIRRWVQDPFDPLEPKVYLNSKSEYQLTNAGIPSTSGYDSDFTSGWDANADGDFDDPGDLYPWGPGALKYWGSLGGYPVSGNTVMTSAHGVSTVSTPYIGSIKMYESDPNGTHYWEPAAEEYLPAAPGLGTHSKGYYHDKAGLTILTQANGTVQILDEDGVDITSSLPGVVSFGNLYDARQAGSMTKRNLVTKIDLAVLKAKGAYPSNGLIYAGTYGSGQGVKARGVQLFNGAELAAPLTVVTENPLYIQGDFNTVKKTSAAVIGDAVNLLSNGWNNSKSKGVLPKAKATTYNVALITGNMETKGGNYNGGLENLPRLHENWSGIKLTLKGSFVNTWENVYATGRWQLGGYFYTPPVRDFSYDTMFNNAANLPPFTPMTVVTADVAVW